MTRKCLAVVVLAMMFVSVASAQDAKTVIANATKAMGYESLNTIQYSGPISKEGAGLGQWISPTKGWHHNTVRDFTRFIDYSAGTSQRTEHQSEKVIRRRDCCLAAADWIHRQPPRLRAPRTWPPTAHSFKSSTSRCPLRDS